MHYACQMADTFVFNSLITFNFFNSFNFPKIKL